MNRKVQMSLCICSVSSVLSLLIYKGYKVYMNRKVLSLLIDNRYEV